MSDLREYIDALHVEIETFERSLQDLGEPATLVSRIVREQLLSKVAELRTDMWRAIMEERDATDE